MINRRHLKVVVHRRLTAFRLKHDFKRNLFAFDARLL